MSEDVKGVSRKGQRTKQKRSTGSSAVKETGKSARLPEPKSLSCPACRCEVSEPGLCEDCRREREELRQEAMRDLCTEFGVPSFSRLPEEIRQQFHDLWRSMRVR
jgi:hypothetical protein